MLTATDWLAFFSLRTYVTEEGQTSWEELVQSSYEPPASFFLSSIFKQLSGWPLTAARSQLQRAQSLFKSSLSISFLLSFPWLGSQRTECPRNILGSSKVPFFLLLAVFHLFQEHALEANWAWARANEKARSFPKKGHRNKQKQLGCCSRKET